LDLPLDEDAITEVFDLDGVIGGVGHGVLSCRIGLIRTHEKHANCRENLKPVLGAVGLNLLLAETVELGVDEVDDLDGDHGGLRQIGHGVPFVGVSLLPVKYPRSKKRKPV
jgi:hypothetical protein